MTQMDNKESLRSLRTLSAEMESHTEHMVQLQRKMQRIGHENGQLCAALQRSHQKLLMETGELNERVEQLERAIARLDDPKQRAVLRMRYVHG